MTNNCTTIITYDKSNLCKFEAGDQHVVFVCKQSKLVMVGLDGPTRMAVWAREGGGQHTTKI